MVAAPGFIRTIEFPERMVLFKDFSHSPRNTAHQFPGLFVVPIIQQAFHDEKIPFYPNRSVPISFGIIKGIACGEGWHTVWTPRSEERRVGKEWFGTCKSGWG